MGTLLLPLALLLPTLPEEDDNDNDTNDDVNEDDVNEDDVGGADDGVWRIISTSLLRTLV